MQYPQLPRREVGLSAAGVNQMRLALQGDRHRVDGEVAAPQVCLQISRRLDHRQRSRLRVALRPYRGDVQLVPVHLHLRGAETLMGDSIGIELSSQRRRVADDDQVDIRPPATEQQVADRAADEIDRIVRHVAHAGKLGVHVLQRLGDALGVVSGG